MQDFAWHGSYGINQFHKCDNSKILDVGKYIIYFLGYTVLGEKTTKQKRMFLTATIFV